MLRKDTRRGFSPSHDLAEIAKFDAMAAAWRDPDGAYRVVHAFNRARVTWLTGVLECLVGPMATTHPRLLDVGCATGLVSEAMAVRGAQVTGIDAAARNVALAQACAAKAGLAVDYRVALPEELAGEGYRIVLALEVVEHVLDKDAFLRAVFACAAQDGVVAIATLNRTLLSWLIGIVMAEYVLRWLPKGTHDWRSFVKPSEIDRIAAASGYGRVAETGFTFNPLRWRWQTVKSLSVNYMLVYQSLDIKR